MFRLTALEADAQRIATLPAADGTCGDGALVAAERETCGAARLVQVLDELGDELHDEIGIGEIEALRCPYDYSVIRLPEAFGQALDVGSRDTGDFGRRQRRATHYRPQCTHDLADVLQRARHLDDLADAWTLDG